MIDIAQEDVKRGLLGLVFAIVDIVQEVCAHAALQRVERGSLTDDEVERIGNAMADIEEAIAELKAELGVGEAAQEIRDQLDGLVNDLLGRLSDPKGGLLGVPNGHTTRPA